MKEIKILRNALQRPLVKGLSLISPKSLADVVLILSKEPGAEYISEWKYEMAGRLKYKYRFHDAKEGRELRELYEKGKRSSLPKLTGVYTRKELLSLNAA